MPEKFSASRAARHMACHASADLPAAIPNWVEPERIVGGAADQGSAVHALLEQAVQLSASDMGHLIKILEYMRELRSRRRFKVLTEVTIKATWLKTEPETTVDVVLYTQDEIHVVDYKWGKIHVEVNDNDQLMFYSASFAHLAPKAKGVTQHILQPRADNMESVFVTASELGVWMDQARAAEAAIQGGSLTFGPSDHCAFCPAYPHSRGAKGKPLCPATMQMLYPSHVDEDAILDLI